MNYKPLFKLQKGLDNHIEREKGLPQEFPDRYEIIESKKDALQVEIAELQNEVRYFKFWSNKGMDRDKALEEYVDALHFFLSLGLDFDVPYEFNHAEILESGNVAKQFRTLHRYILAMEGRMHWYTAFSLFRGLGEMLGFTEDEIVNVYHSKNAVNHHRQEAGY